MSDSRLPCLTLYQRPRRPGRAGRGRARPGAREGAVMRWRNALEALVYLWAAASAAGAAVVLAVLLLPYPDEDIIRESWETPPVGAGRAEESFDECVARHEREGLNRWYAEESCADEAGP